MTHDLSLHPLEPGRLDLLLALMREYYAVDRLDFDPARARAAAAMVLEEPALGAIWLVEVAGAPAGYCVLGSAFSLEFHGRIAFVDELYLREEFRGRGHGARLLALLEEECRARGLRAMRLEVERSNRRARSLYERAGFVRHDRFIMTKWLQRGSG